MKQRRRRQFIPLLENVLPNHLQEFDILFELLFGDPVAHGSNDVSGPGFLNRRIMSFSR